MIGHVEEFSVTESRDRENHFLGIIIILMVVGMFVQALLTPEFRTAALWLLGILFGASVVVSLVLALCLGAVSKDADRAAKEAFDDWQNKRTRSGQ